MTNSVAKQFLLPITQGHESSQIKLKVTQFFRSFFNIRIQFIY